MPPDVLYGRRNRVATNYVENYEGELYLMYELLVGYMEPSETIVSTILSALKKNANTRFG